jgi:hypothetical protein
MWQWFRVALVALVLAAAPAAAEDRLDAVAAALDRATAHPKAETAAVERMSAILKVAPDALRAQRAGVRLGWGDFYLAHRIAMRGAHPVEKVFAARRTGTGWSEIAEEANVNADALVQDVAIVSPDAAKAVGAPASGGPAPPAAATSPEEPKGLGAKIRDMFGGTPGPPPADGGKPANPAQEDIRDKMIRGGGRSR